MDEKVEEASPSPAPPEEPEVEYTFSPGMLARLATLNVALAFTSYQSGFLYFLGRYQGGAHLHRTAIGRPMGLARSESGGLALATEAEIMRFENALRPDQRANERFDACYGPAPSMSRALSTRTMSGWTKAIVQSSSTRASTAWRRPPAAQVSSWCGSRRSFRVCSTATNAISMASPCKREARVRHRSQPLRHHRRLARPARKRRGGDRCARQSHCR